jgi:hypothetical protein
LQQQRAYDEKGEIVTEGEACMSKENLLKELVQMFQNLGTFKQQIMDLDLNVERNMLVRQALGKGMSCCHKFYEEKKVDYSCLYNT